MKWTLHNPSSEQGHDLVVRPFTTRQQVGPDQFHFQFGFKPGTLTVEPELQGCWDVAVSQQGPTIQIVYLAYRGPEDLVIEPNNEHHGILAYVNAVQSNANDATVHVTLTAGSQVLLGGRSIKGKSYLGNLKLIPSNLPAVSATPISVDFVGRRSVLNNSKTPNSLTFALTNMMAGSISVSTATKFTVWFDTSPGWYQAAPKLDPQPDFDAWGLASQATIHEAELHAPSDWKQPDKNPPDPRQTESLSGPELTVSTHWTLTVPASLALKPQQPVLFTFTGLKSGVPSGITRMYLQYQGLHGFPDGVLILQRKVF